MRIQAEPDDYSFEPASTALVIIDMQRDFLEPGGFGAALGNDVSLLSAAIEPTRHILEAARSAGIFVIHTREGHRPDLSDAPKRKLVRGAISMRIGAPGPMGRILVRGQPGHGIISQLAPRNDEPVIDKPGKGAFYQTDLEAILRYRNITHLILCGVTTEVCVHTTLREANDRGFWCLVAGDACGSYFPEFHRVALDMVKAQGGIFGWVSDSAAVCSALSTQNTSTMSLEAKP